jgi:uncharacterized protein (TIGR03118 family)
MRKISRSWKSAARLGFAVVSAGGVAEALHACSSDNSPAAAGPDASVVVTDAGIVLQKVTPTVILADQSDAGAVHVDPDVVNAWGLAFAPTGTAWISDNGTGKATLFPPNADGGPIPSIIVPAPAAAVAKDAGATSAPTGVRLNTNSSAFLGDVFIFATEDGTIAGWQPSVPAMAQIRVDNSAGSPTTNAVYKGLAIIPTTPPRLVAANFRSATIEVFDASYRPLATVAATSSRVFFDATIPAGYAPFNVAVFGTSVVVTYAVQDAAKHDDVAGQGKGAVSIFDFNGNVVKSLIPVTAGGPLSSPWGLAIAPASWGALGGALIVGNFGDGTIHAFNALTGSLVGQLVGPSGSPLVLDGLWSTVFGTNADAGLSPNALFFTSGPNMENNGRYGVLTLPQ